MRHWQRYGLIGALLVSFGCAGPPAHSKYSWELYLAPQATPEMFVNQRLAILPAVSIEYEPTQEVYRETLAGLLYDTLKKHSKNPEIIPLDEVQGSINRTGLWSDVLLMYHEYETTAVLRKDILTKVGQAINARYVLMPKLLHFQQEAFDRATMLGISVLRTRQSTVDIQAQIWDTTTGEVVWQGVGEGSEAAEVVQGRPVSFVAVAQGASESLASRMPWIRSDK